jgi:CHC2 zinc finger/DNA primase catalytic core, N-terminal domain/Toprim-like
MNTNKLYQFYVYLVNNCRVRISDVADVFAVHRATVWRNIRKLEIANLIRTQRTYEGVKIEKVGEWRQDASQVKVVPRKARDSNVASKTALREKKKVRELKKKGGRGNAKMRQIVPDVAAGIESNVAFGPSRKCVDRAGNVAFQEPAATNVSYIENHTVPQLVTRACVNPATLVNEQAGTTALNPIGRQEGEITAVSLANVLILPARVSTDRVRAAATWIREWIDLPVYLHHLGITVQRENRSGEHPCLCPLHGDTEPSMYANREKGIWYCHACSISGDAAEMVRHMYGMRFGDAVRKVLKDVRQLLLKDDTRVLLAKPEEAYRAWLDWGKSRRTRSQTMHKRETTIVSNSLLKMQRREQAHKYASDLCLSHDAQNFLRKRGLDANTIRTYGIGWDPKTNSIVFPNRDAVTGDVLGFTYRSIVPTSKKRYRNTPDDSLFQKGAVLFGLYEVMEEAKRSKTLYLVEGGFDAILLRQELRVPAAAMQASHLSIEQACLIERVIGKDVKIYVVRDNDEAGEQGAELSKKTLQSKGFDYEVLRPKDVFKDIAEQLQTEKQERMRTMDKINHMKDFLEKLPLSVTVQQVNRCLENIEPSVLSADERLEYRPKMYQQIGALFFVDGVDDFADYTLNSGTANVTVSVNAVATLNLVVTT